MKKLLLLLLLPGCALFDEVTLGTSYSDSFGGIGIADRAFDTSEYGTTVYLEGTIYLGPREVVVIRSGPVYEPNLPVGDYRGPDDCAAPESGATGPWIGRCAPEDVENHVPLEAPVEPADGHDAGEHLEATDHEPWWWSGLLAVLLALGGGGFVVRRRMAAKE